MVPHFQCTMTVWVIARKKQIKLLSEGAEKIVLADNNRVGKVKQIRKE